MSATLVWHVEICKLQLRQNANLNSNQNPHSNPYSNDQATGKADFLFNRTVTKIERSGGRVSGVTLDDGSVIHTPVVVNVAGPHSSLVSDDILA